MKRKIKLIQLKDGKQIYYPSDAELKELWDYVERVDIEESYSIEEWKRKFVVIRGLPDNDPRMTEEINKANRVMYEAWKDKTKLW